MNNTKSVNVDLSVNELNENSKVLTTSGYETINGRQTLKEGINHPFNIFSFQLGFKHSNSDFWTIRLGVDNIINSDKFKLNLEGSKIVFSGELILKTSIKDKCFNDLLLNLNKTFIDECSVVKVINQSWKGKQSYRFTYTGGDWNKDNEIKKNIIENTNNPSRIIGLEHSKSLRKSWN
ncbi:MAG: hypothetical protein P8H44_04460 [Flavobacteriaceae bacterium]|nr:hypothetical protein [Flavobacteriaceae bacterium]